MSQTAYKNLVENLANAALKRIRDSAKEALTPQAGLPNGYASLNPISVNKYINQLDDPGGPVAGLLRQIASTANKTAKLNFLKSLPDAVGQEQGLYDLLVGDASTQPHSLEAYLKLTKALADLAGEDTAPLAQVLQIGTSGADVLVAYANLLYGKAALEQLNTMDNSKAKALATLDSTMKQHVAALKAAEVQLTDCEATQHCSSEKLNCLNNCMSLLASSSSESSAICYTECKIADDSLHE